MTRNNNKNAKYQHLSNLINGPDDFIGFPFVEIHRHLDGGPREDFVLDGWQKLGFENCPVQIPPSIIELWISNPSVPACGGRLSDYENIRKANKAEARKLFRDWFVARASGGLTPFIEMFGVLLPIMQSKESLTRLVNETIEDCVASGMIGVELRFAAQAFANPQTGFTDRDAMETIIDCIKQAPIPVGLIECSLRHQTDEQMMQSAKLAVEYMPWVTGKDHAADEVTFPGLTRGARRSLLYAKKHGLKLTSHQGEIIEAPPSESDERFFKRHKVKRGGHCIAGTGWQKGLVLEVCIVSNVVTGQFERIEDHNVNELIAAGALVTFNTDDPIFTGTQMQDEAWALFSKLEWTIDRLVQATVQAINASFFDSKTKKRLRAEFRTRLAQWISKLQSKAA